MLATFQYQEIIDRALQEDIGTGDLSARIIPAGLTGMAKLYAKQTGIVAGLALASETFRRVDDRIGINVLAQDGEKVAPGQVVMEVTGPLSGILQAERTALNFMQHLSGIATITRQAVEKVQGFSTSIVDTRKTLPGFRILQKYAVRAGGGYNHRFGLYDGIMLKDNHIAAAGGLTVAVEMAKKQIGHMVKIEVECETIAQVQEALACGVDVIMLDNMTLAEMREAVKLIKQRAIVEASGGITLDKLTEVAATGVDVISLGFLTHSVTAVDFSLDIGQIKEHTLKRLQSEGLGGA